jgi:hypothetical protein
VTPTRTTPGTGRLRLGELLVKAGVITETQLVTALQEQKQWGGKLGDLLVRMNYLSEDIFVRALSKQLGLPRADFGSGVPPGVVGLVPREVIDAHEVLPLAVLDEGKAIALATSDPLNFSVLDQVRSITGLRVVPHVASTNAIRAAIARAFATEAQSDQPLVIVSNSEDRAVSHRVGAPARTDPPPRSDAGSRVEMVSIQEVTAPARTEATPLRREQTPMRSQPPPVRSEVSVPAAPRSAGPRRPPAEQIGATGSRPPPPRPSIPQTPPRPTGQPGGQPFFTPPEGLPAVQPKLSLSGRGGPAADDPPGQNVALKALIELLVQKGVISLDEYLARLKR